MREWSAAMRKEGRQLDRQVRCKCSLVDCNFPYFPSRLIVSFSCNPVGNQVDNVTTWC